MLSISNAVIFEAFEVISPPLLLTRESVNLIIPSLFIVPPLFVSLFCSIFPVVSFIKSDLFVKLPVPVIFPVFVNAELSVIVPSLPILPLLVDVPFPFNVNFESVPIFDIVPELSILLLIFNSFSFSTVPSLLNNVVVITVPLFESFPSDVIFNVPCWNLALFSTVVVPVLIFDVPFPFTAFPILLFPSKLTVPAFFMSSFVLFANATLLIFTVPFAFTSRAVVNPFIVSTLLIVNVFPEPTVIPACPFPLIAFSPPLTTNEVPPNVPKSVVTSSSSNIVYTF